MIRVLLNIGHTIFREGILRILKTQKDFTLLKGKTTLPEMQRSMSKDVADVILIDSVLLEKFWRSFLKDILSQKETPPVIVIGISGNDAMAHRLLVKKIAAYLNESASSKEMIAAIRIVSLGRKYISTRQGEHFADVLISQIGFRNPQISNREYQVMNLLLDGKTVTEIAVELQLHVKTISTYRLRLLKKLDLKNEMELVRFSS